MEKQGTVLQTLLDHRVAACMQAAGRFERLKQIRADLDKLRVRMDLPRLGIAQSIPLEPQMGNHSAGADETGRRTN